MKPDRATSPRFACCLLLSAVLVLGIVQWSFLPLLIQNTPLTGRAFLEASGNHTSKFAAPFKYLFGDSLKPYISRTRVTTPRMATTFVHRPEEPAPNWDHSIFYISQLRAPPSA